MSALFTDAQLERLLDNGRRQDAVRGTQDELDLVPVVKLFTPDGGATWLLTELDADGDTAFGLCDLGLGVPELGCVSLAELRSVRGKLGLAVERDRHFEASKPLSAYADEAGRLGY